MPGTWTISATVDVAGQIEVRVFAGTQPVLGAQRDLAGQRPGLADDGGDRRSGFGAGDDARRVRDHDSRCNHVGSRTGCSSIAGVRQARSARRAALGHRRPATDHLCHGDGRRADPADDHHDHDVAATETTTNDVPPTTTTDDDGRHHDDSTSTTCRNDDHVNVDDHATDRPQR